MYVLCNIEEHSCKHYGNGKPIHITYPDCVFVALGIQHAMSLRHIAICGLSVSTIISTLSLERRNLLK